MEVQRTRARSRQQFSSAGGKPIMTDVPSEFVGYETTIDKGVVVALFDEDDSVELLEPGRRGIVVLDKTPFYGESGGQVGDTGKLTNGKAEFTVDDTQKQGNAILHIGILTGGSLRVDDVVEAQVDSARRQATVLNHSATHLLHAALRKILGDQVEQKGSLVAPGYLRFDFSHNQPVDRATLDQIERWVNCAVRENQATGTREMSMDEAIEAGAIALFGEKYGDRVRVVNMGESSVELCGGTHVLRTGDIGLLRILSETGIASGVRRIEAVTGDAAWSAVAGDANTLVQLAGSVKTSRDKLQQKIQQIIKHNKELQKEIGQLQQKLAAQTGDRLSDSAIDVDGVKVLAVRLEPAPNSKILRETADKLSDKIGDGVIVLAGVDGGKVMLVARVAKSLTDKIRAGDMVNAVATQIGGKGGGRADMAQAGGSQPENLAAALDSVPEWVRRQLETI
jgi:alanyl-tRNA synthetase